MPGLFPGLSPWATSARPLCGLKNGVIPQFGNSAVRHFGNLLQKFVQAFGIEADHHFFPDDEGGGRTALVAVNQFLDGGGIGAHVAVFKIDTSLREVGLDGPARRSAGLGKHNDFRWHGHLKGSDSHIAVLRFYPTSNSISAVIFAVACSIAETEQYFSLERRTASSTALRETGPPTR